VNNLPHRTTEESLWRIYNRYRDDIDSIKVINSHSECYAYINFTDEGSADRAYRRSSDKLGNGVSIVCKWKEKQQIQQYTLKVTNISPSINRQMEDFCRKFHNFESIKINPEGYAYVNFTSKESAEHALGRLNGMMMGSQRLSAKLHNTSESYRSRSTSPKNKALDCDSRHSSLPYYYSSPLPAIGSPSSQGSSTIKVTINGTGVTSHDILTYFSQFGPIVKPYPVIMVGSPHYTYVNYTDMQSAMRACHESKIRLKNVELNIKLSKSQPTPVAVADKDSTVVECTDDPLAGLILKVCHLDEVKEDLKDVFVQPSDKGVVLSGDASVVRMAEKVVEMKLRHIKSQITSGTNQFHCCYIPSLEETENFVQLEEMHAVEFYILTSQQRKERLASFAATLQSHKGDGPITLADISEYTTSDDDDSYPYTWEYTDDSHVFVPMSAQDGPAIEKLFQSDSSRVSYKRDKWTYLIDFIAMTQTNTSTYKVRNIRRVHASSAALSCNSQVITISCRGLLEQVEKSLDELGLILRQSVTIRTLDKCSAIKKPMLELAGSYCIEIDEDSQNDQISMKSNEKYLTKVMMALKDKQIILQASLHQSVPSISCYPDEWKQPQHNNVELIDVVSYCEEWNSIQREMKNSIPNVIIRRIQRVQNKMLYDKYNFCKRQMRDKNHGVINELRLFHGTKTNDPENIYSSEHGFDFRFSNSGVWGKGAYFAVNASYSTNYAYRPSTGYQQIFMAFVLTGHSKDTRPDTSLTMPPCKDGSTKERYDSVNGVSGSSRIYVVYDHEKSYPAYLITFQ
jgi:RNA recognition motif-containing protein